MLRWLATFKWAFLATAVALVVGAIKGGAAALVSVATLIALEASISFDNAVVNAGVLRRMSDGWRRAFLTVGLAVAVFGMRVFFPIAVVALATNASLGVVVDQALHDQHAYASGIEKAAPLVETFGGTFLALVAMTFFMSEDRHVHWLGPVERALARCGRIRSLPAAVAAGLVLLASRLAPRSDTAGVMTAGLIGIVSFLTLRGISRVLGGDQDEEKTHSRRGQSGAAGLVLFLYVELLDASFSLDGVLGAFAISRDVVIIGLGLGAGAVYVRSLTIALVRRGTLRTFPYLANGAHWAIAALSATLIASLAVHVPDWVTAVVALGFVAAALVSSLVHRSRESGDDTRETSAAPA